MKTNERPFHEVDRLVNENIALAYHFVGLNWSWNHDDALSTALEGLHCAAVEWDESRDIPFGSFASLRIKWTFMKTAYRRRALKRGRQFEHVALDAPITEGAAAPVGDFIADQAAGHPGLQAETVHELDWLRSVWGKLTAQQQDVLASRFGFAGPEQTLEQVAARWKLTRERIRQIECKAIDRLNYLRRMAGLDDSVKVVESYYSKMLKAKCKRMAGKWGPKAADRKRLQVAA